MNNLENVEKFKVIFGLKLAANCRSFLFKTILVFIRNFLIYHGVSLLSFLLQTVAHNYRSKYDWNTKPSRRLFLLEQAFIHIFYIWIAASYLYLSEFSKKCTSTARTNDMENRNKYQKYKLLKLFVSLPSNKLALLSKNYVFFIFYS